MAPAATGAVAFADGQRQGGALASLLQCELANHSIARLILFLQVAPCAVGRARRGCWVLVGVPHADAELQGRHWPRAEGRGVSPASRRVITHAFASV